MRIFNKIAAGILALACCVGIVTGCGGNKGDQPEQGATVVSVWLRDFEDWSNAAMKKSMDDFNKDKTDGLHIKYRFIADEAFGDALKAAQDNGTAPDIYQVSYVNLYSQVRENTVLALDDILPSSAFEDLKDSAKELVTYNGHYYAYPYLTEPAAVMYYRKDLLQQAGVDYSKADEWSFDELYAACDKLKTVMSKKEGKYPFIGFDFGAIGWASQGLQANLTGGDVCLTEDWTKTIIDSEPYKELAEHFHVLYENEYVPAEWGTPYNDHVINLCDGTAAIVYSGSWGIAEIMESYGAEMAEKIGVAHIATLNGGKEKGTTTTNGGWSYIIDAKSKNPEAAGKVIEYLAAGEDTKVLEDFFEAAHYSKSITRKSIQAKADAKDTSAACPQEWLQTVSDIADAGIPESIYSYDVNIQLVNLLQGVAIDALDGIPTEESWKNRIDEIIKEVNKIIENSNLAGNNPRLAK